MRIFQNTLVSLLITASIIIAGVTVFLLSVRGRPDAAADMVGEANAAQGEIVVAQETPAVLPVPEMALVEGATILLSPQPGELVRRADSLPVPEVVVIDPTPVPDVVIVVDPAVQGDGAPTITPFPTIQIVDPQPTAVPVPVATAVVVVSSPDLLVQPIIFANHQVAAGETLYSIAKFYNSAVELLAANGISSANLIPGAMIQVPYPNPAYCPNMTPYVVREKDTVFRIASYFGRTIEQIRDTNGLGADYRVNIAQVLCIP